MDISFANYRKVGLSHHTERNAPANHRTIKGLSQNVVLLLLDSSFYNWFELIPFDFASPTGRTGELEYRIFAF